MLCQHSTSSRFGTSSPRYFLNAVSPIRMPVTTHGSPIGGLRQTRPILVLGAAFSTLKDEDQSAGRYSASPLGVRQSEQVRSAFGAPNGDVFAVEKGNYCRG